MSTSVRLAAGTPGRSTGAVEAAPPWSSSSRSSTVTLNKKTPKMLPWGQPPVTALSVDQVCPTRTDMVLLVKKVANSRRIAKLAPFLANDLKQCW